MFRKHWIVPFLMLIPVLRIFAMDTPNNVVEQKPENGGVGTDVMVVE